MNINELAVRLLPAFVLAWLRSLEIYLCEHKLTAMVICKLIPAQCPFERDLDLGPVHLHIPPMCKLNPLYEVFVMLRFHSLCFLEEHKQEFKLSMENFY